MIIYFLQKKGTVQAVLQDLNEEIQNKANKYQNLWKLWSYFSTMPISSMISCMQA